METHSNQLHLHEHNFFSILWPLIIEVFLSVLVGLADTLMLYGVGEQAVGSVGSAVTYFNFLNVSFIIFNTGALAVFTQFVGAKKYADAKKALKTSILANALIGLIIGLILIFFSLPILQWVMGESELVHDASIYLSIVGFSSIFIAITPIIGNYMRSFGHDKSPMVASIIANLVNIVLNYLSIFVFSCGVAGVAWATVTSHAVNLILNIILAKVHLPAIKEESLMKLKVIIKDLLKVGLPSALEIFMFYFSMAGIVSILNQLDPQGFQVAVRVTVEHIASLAFIPAVALAHANSIKTGFCVGRSCYLESEKGTLKVVAWGLIVSVAIAILVALFSTPIINIFTGAEHTPSEELPELIHLVKTCLWIHVIIEIGRSSNLILGEALKVSGDSIFVGIVGFISLLVVALGGSFFFTNILDWAVIGVFIAIGLDEILRAIVMFIRWQSRVWESKRLI